MSTLGYRSNPAEVEVDPLQLNDLADLPASVTLTADDLVPILRDRALEGLPFTELSSRVLVSVNPHQPTQATSDAQLLRWSAEYGDSGTDGVRGAFGPHLWATGSKAYFHMRRTGQDQSIVLSGETGSGKTEAVRLLLRYLLDLSAPPPGKKGTKVAASIPAAFFILNAFGEASTITNSSASRFGRYTELQFSDKGRVVGLKGLEYYLEKSRVTQVSAGERNFNIFHYLVSGASPDERQHLHLGNPSSFRYLPSFRGSASPDTHDAAPFGQLKEAFKAIGFPKKVVASLCQILAAILHLGNIDFVIDRQRSTDAAVVKNQNVLQIVAEFLGVEPADLEHALTNKSTLVGGEMCSVFLDVEGSAANRDDLAKALYGLVFSWIGEFLNEKLCRDDFTTFIALVDFPGPVLSSGSHESGIDAFCFNLASERLHAFYLEQLFETKKEEYRSEGVAASLPGLDVGYHSNSECLRVLTNTPGGLVHIIDDQSRRKGKTDATMLKAMSKRWGNHTSFGGRDGDESLGRPGTFLCSHWDGQVTYSVENFLAHNSSAVAPSFVSLLGGTVPAVGAGGRTTPGARDQLSTGGSSFSFVRQLFSGDAMQTTTHPKSEETVVSANQKVGPRRAPSTRRPMGKSTTKDPKAEEAEEELKIQPDGGRSIVREFNDSITLLLATLTETQSWFVVCLRPNDAQLPNQVDPKLLKHQIRSFGLTELSRRLGGEWGVNLEQKEFYERYSSIPPVAAESGVLAPLMYRDKAVKVREILGWSEREMAIGTKKVFLSDAAFRIVEDYLRHDDPEEHLRKAERGHRDPTTTSLPDPFAPHSRGVFQPALEGYDSRFAGTTSTAALPFASKGQLTPLYDDDYFERQTSYTEGGSDYFGSKTPKGSHRFDEEQSIAPSGYAPSRAMFDPLSKPSKEDRGADDAVVIEEVKITSARRWWVALTWLFTWWIPSFCLSSCGGMKRRDVRMAWREKLLINMLIWLLCGIAVFVIAILGNLICPKEYVYSTSELSSASYSNDPDNMLVAIRGEAFDLTSFAPLHVPGASVIPLRTVQKYGGLDATSIFPVQVSALCNGVDGSVSPWVTLDSANSTTTVSQYHDFRAFQDDSRPDWYTETMIYLRYNFRKGFIGYKPSEIKTKANAGSVIAIYDNGVYDLSTFVTNNGGGIQTPTGTVAANDTDRYFMSQDVVSLFQRKAGTDLTYDLNNLAIDANVLARQKICLRNLFFIGKVDNRNSVQCKFANYILLALSIVMVSIIGFKFLAALQFGRSRKPEDYDKFVICQVPCYTEGEESLKACIDSLTKLKYDDKRKLLFIICDGMIVGSGNDRPTPRIVLDILGADPSIDPEPLSFLSVGDGAKQHNMAKVYSGLHEAAGHIVPYIVVVKVGKPTEKNRPGNRGKRDSQMLLMRFLNRVHFDAPMSPCELEIYHQIKNVIGVNPSFYEYLLMIDADTVVAPTSLNYLIVVGLCGETSLANAKASWTTMLQVYEYFISHYLAKAFESLFGSVTCLPGCFSMYRVRSVDYKPLIISNNLVREYGVNRVDTLHTKNLLSLGEDRYLTTLMLREFPELKTKFCSAAKAETIAPDDWKVLFSQRRRWINSTIHNLAELLFIDKMCGVCCFSMRFVVMIDLASTLVAPVTVAYIGYLIYLVAGEGKAIPLTALIMLSAIYGLQALIFIFHRKFEHIGWMVLYIIGIPLFSFVLPLDDFSWGSTREIVGEKGKRVVVHDEGKFDPSSIPLKSWQDFENELWEAGSNHSIGSLIENSKQEAEVLSNYGQESIYPGAYQGSNPSASPFGSRSFGADQPTHVMGRPSFGGSYQTLDPFAGGRATPSVFGGQSMTSGYFNRPYGSNPTLNELANRPVSYATNILPTSRSTSPMGALPSDNQILVDVNSILASADLTTVTKKGVRTELEQLYGCPLGDKKGYVNRVIEAALGL
ncbi:chitin synthase, glycosyltransferase family 2 protein [Pseudohyphozyma bogoriensis]|nr:chitin synthase, glycosyltransferase family 2 protein [Pseudohyphozyma bogoriensis]